MKKEKLKVAELWEVLKARGVDSKGKKDKLQEQCQNLVPTVPIEKEIPNVLKEGWYGTAKGVDQILWERGYIKPCVEYTLKGKKDADGNLIRGTSLNLLIQKSSDFVNEPTMLQLCHH